jgi:putative salt-induced outer membrane protein
MKSHRLRVLARHSFAVCALLAMSLPAAAQWTGKGEAGLAIADGNSDTKTANAKITIGKKVDSWEHSLGLAGLYVRNDGETSARRWESFAQTQYSFGGGHTFWFGALRYEEDRFSGFDHQGVVDTGVGRKFIDTDATKLSGKLGVGYKFFETLDTPRHKDSSVAATAGVDFSHQLTATTSVFNKFGAEATSGNTFVQDELGLAVKMSDRLALAVGYAVRHNSDPPAGFKKTDSLTTANLVYEVK